MEPPCGIVAIAPDDARYIWIGGIAQDDIVLVEDAPKVMAAVTAAVAQGGLTVREASDVAQLVEAYVRSVEASDLEKRLRAIEENLK